MKNHVRPSGQIRCALYDRVSTEMQAESGRSLETQRNDLERYAREHGYIIAGHYADEGITARKKMQNRRDFLRLLADVEADKIDLILVTKLDRWFRNIRDYYATQEILEKHHCSWKTIYEDYDSSTADGQLKINIMLSVAQNECDRTSERIKAVFRHKIQLGEITTSSLVYFGYRAVEKRLVIDEEKAPVVRDAYRKFFETHSKKTAFHYCLQKYGDVFSYQTFKHFFTAEIYAGKYQSNDHFCPPYLTPDQWREIRRINEKNIKIYTSSGTPAVYLFSGLLKCPECGSALSGTSVKTRYGHINRYYRCWKHRSGSSCGCGKTFSELQLEKYLVSQIILPLPPLSQLPEVRPARAKRPAVSVRAYEGQLKRLNELYIRGSITSDAYEEKYASIHALLKYAEESARPSECRAAPPEPLETTLENGWQRLYDTLDPEHRRSFWHQAIESVRLGEDRTVRSVTLFQGLDFPRLT